MQDIDRNRTSLTSPAMEDVYNSELIYLLKNNETERYLTTYDPTAYSNEYSIVERMVVDKKRKFTDESMNLIDDRLNELYVPAEEDEKHEVAFDWLRYIKMRIPTEFPFYYFFDGIRTFFTLTDNPEELPNIDVVKYWKIIDGSRMYESFVGEWMEVKHNLPEFLASTLNGSHFTTVSQLLAEKYFSRPCFRP